MLLLLLFVLEPLELSELDPVPPVLELLFVLLEDEEEDPGWIEPLPLAAPLPLTEPLPEPELPDDDGVLCELDGVCTLLVELYEPLPDEPLPDVPLVVVESVPPMPPGLLQPARRAANAKNNSCFFIRIILGC